MSLPLLPDALPRLPPVDARRHRPSPRSVPFRIVAWLRLRALAAKRGLYRRVLGMDLHPTCTFSLKANLDLTNPKGVHIGAYTYIAFDAVILAHDQTRLVHAHTRVGRNCFVGARSIILPGVTVGDECIVAAGAVVTKDVPAHSIVAGNPAVVIRSGISCLAWGTLRERVEIAEKESRDPRLS